jgi:hypothetical protein
MNAAKKAALVVASAGLVAGAGAGAAVADSSAPGTAAGSPGIASGNNVQVPVHVPAEICGNTVGLVGLLNPASGNTCAAG